MMPLSRRASLGRTVSSLGPVYVATSRAACGLRPLPAALPGPGPGDWAEWPLCDTAGSSGRGLPLFIFPAQPCVPTDAPKGCLWGLTGALKFAISLGPAASNKPTVLSSEYRRGDSRSEQEMRATAPHPLPKPPPTPVPHPVPCSGLSNIGFLNGPPITFHGSFFPFADFSPMEAECPLAVSLTCCRIRSHPKLPSCYLSRGRGPAGLRRAALLLILLQVSHVVIRLWLGWSHPRARPAPG